MKLFLNAVDVVKELASTSSTTKKLELLKNTVGTDLEKNIVFYFSNALNPELNFYIKKIPEYSVSTKLYGGFSDDFKILLKKLSNRTITGNAAKEEVKKCLSEMLPDYAELACNILLKDPKCGVSAKTFLKAYPHALPEMPKLCKANSYSEKNIGFIKYPAISQRKADGARVLVFTGNECVKPKIISGNGKELHGLNSIIKYAKKHFPFNYVIDGELLFVNDGKTLDRKTGNGYASKCILGTLEPEIEKNARICAWDIFPVSVYEEREKSERYALRFLYLTELCGNSDEIKYIDSIESKVVYSKDEAFNHFKEMIERGEEGTILKNTSFIWQGKRIKDCCKFKIAVQNTFKVTGFEYGNVNSKYAGKLGALTCESSDGKIVVNVGSGFSDSERNSLTPENTIGKCIEVVSNGIIDSKTSNGVYSLFLPRYIEFRLDKNEADSYEAVKASVEGSNNLIRGK